MENNYLKLIPEELSILIFSYLNNNYYLNNLYEEYKIDIEKVFMYKYNTLHKIIKEINESLLSHQIINWEILYKDMEHINYETIKEILNGDKLKINDMIEFDIEDKLGLLHPSTFDIIYTCLFTKVNSDSYKMRNLIDSPYLMMYLYINMRLCKIELMYKYMDSTNDNIIQQFKVLLIGIFISYNLDCDVNQFVMLGRRIIPTLYNTYKSILDNVLINPDNDNFYQKVYDYCLSNTRIV